jgi:hypothetical protein
MKISFKHSIDDLDLSMLPVFVAIILCLIVVICVCPYLFLDVLALFGIFFNVFAIYDIFFIVE